MTVEVNCTNDSFQPKDAVLARELRAQQNLSRSCMNQEGIDILRAFRSDTSQYLPSLDLFGTDSGSASNPGEIPTVGGQASSVPEKALTTPTDASNSKKVAAPTDKSTTSASDSTIPQSPVPGTGSTATTFGIDAQPTVNESTPGYYVSPDGSASGDGSKAHPFATLQQAQQAMETSDIKTTYVEGGTYKMSSTLNLTSKDAGESFISVGGANNPAVLDGGGKLSDLISLNGADNVKIEGFSMQNTSNDPVWNTKQHGELNANVGAIYAENSSGDTFAYNNMNNVNVGVNMQNDSNMRVAQNSITNVQSAIGDGANSSNQYGSDNTIQGNLIENVTGWGSKLNDNVGAVNINGVSNDVIRNNVIENTAGVGIQMNYRESGSGFTLANNTIVNTDYDATTAAADTSSNPVGDDGAIHIITNPGNTKQLNGTISNNYIDGAGVNRADKGIYLDDGVNGVTVTGNVVDEGGAGDAMQIHGGDNNIVENNTFYLGSGKGILYQTDGYQMTGNIIENNIFDKTGTGTQAYAFINTEAGDMPIFSGNEYSPGINQSPDPNGTTN